MSTSLLVLWLILATAIGSTANVAGQAVWRAVAARRRPIDPAPSAPLPDRTALTPEERQEIASKWGQVVCIFCGGWHGGLCNRVRRVELDDAGRPKTTVFWERWEANPRTIWPDDVWPSLAVMVTDLESQARQRANELEMQRVAQREARRGSQESQRAETPREAAARIARGG